MFYRLFSALYSLTCGMYVLVFTLAIPQRIC